MAGAADRRVELVARLTAAFGEELAHRDLGAEIPWPTIPTVATMVAHLGGVHRWVAEVVRTQRRAAHAPAPDFSAGSVSARGWFEEGRAALLDALTAVPPETPCWIIGDQLGTAAFWRRRMVFENVKHLIDLRAAGGGGWAAAPELAPADYADGIDELLSEFLPRSRPRLAPLPGPVTLESTDSGRSWRIEPDWAIEGDPAGSDGSARVVARNADLALMLWERADPLDGSGRFQVDGSRAVAALRSAAIHPW